MRARIETSIEAFAELVATLDDPFADRASALAAQNLDETGFARVRERWASKLEAAAEAPDGDGKRFGDAYEHASRRIEATRRREKVPEAQEAKEPKRLDALPAIADDLPPLVPKGMLHFADLGSQQPAFVAPRGKALPFDPSAKPALSESEAQALVPKGMRGFKDLGGTEPSAAAPRGPTLPFRASPPLSLEQYASLCVELSMSPAQAPSILSRYRIDEEQRRRVEDYWREQMQSDAEVREAWNKACKTFRAWLEGQRGGGGA